MDSVLATANLGIFSRAVPSSDNYTNVVTFIVWLIVLCHLVARDIIIPILAESGSILKCFPCLEKYFVDVESAEGNPRFIEALPRKKLEKRIRDGVGFD